MVARWVIIGCGRLGRAVGLSLAAKGHHVRGLRRSLAADDPAWIRAGSGDDPQALSSLGAADGVLIAAAPGLRGGGDNRLERVAAACVGMWPDARRVILSSTAVYADAAGGPVDEDGPVGHDERVGRLLAIEAAAVPHLTLRLGGLIGPERQHVARRIRAAAGAPLEVAGPLDRPFSYCHDADAVAMITWSLTALWRGVSLLPLMNVVAPDPHCTIRDYWNSLARQAGLPLPVLRETLEVQPCRRVIAERLWRLHPQHNWRLVER